LTAPLAPPTVPGPAQHDAAGIPLACDRDVPSRDRHLPSQDDGSPWSGWVLLFLVDLIGLLTLFATFYGLLLIAWGMSS